MRVGTSATTMTQGMVVASRACLRVEAHPMLWTPLGKAGNANLHERQTLLSRYLAVFGARGVAYLRLRLGFIPRQP